MNRLNVSKTGVGYDVRSEGADGEVRYIEVKGHASTGDVTLYYTEWQMAHRMGEEFFIYEVDYALTDPQLRIVQDPVGKGIEPLERVVEYLINTEQLRVAAGESAKQQTWRMSERGRPPEVALRDNRRLPAWRDSEANSRSCCKVGQPIQ